MVKFMLGNLSMGFDIVFVTQHYILYRNNDPERDVNENFDECLIRLSFFSNIGKKQKRHT